MVLQSLGGVSSPRYTGRPCAASGATTADWVQDTSYLEKAGMFLKGGLMYHAQAFRVKMLARLSPMLSEAPRVQIERPFTIVPGLTERPGRYAPLIAHLTEDGQNGGQAYYVKQGQLYSDPDCSLKATATPDAKVFVQVASQKSLAPDLMFAEIEQNMATIQKATGVASVDVLGYSMGGISTRTYLDRGGQGVGKFMMLGTPNQGSHMADMAAWAVENQVKWAMSIGRVGPHSLPALAWLRPGGEKLVDLNRRSDQQLARAEAVCVVGSRGFAMTGRPGATGDGRVSQDDLQLPNADIRVLEGGGTKHHGLLPNDPDVFREMADFFGWKS